MAARAIATTKKGSEAFQKWSSYNYNKELLGFF